MTEIQNKLYSLQDKEYRDFQCALMPTVDREKVIGVRTPTLRKLAREIDKTTAKAFLGELPHKYYEENNLHAFIVERENDIDRCYDLIEDFLPYIDNWATCDSFSPKALKEDKVRLLLHIDKWIAGGKTYTVRYGIGMLMRYFLDEDFSPEYAEKVANISSEEYYVNMMCAWYFATALAKQPESIIPFFEDGRLSVCVHNKAITKACESFRVTKEHKEYLRKLKTKTTG